MKVSELKQLIKQSVNERVVELKEQFEHIETKGTLASEKPSTPDGRDSGDKKMTTGKDPAPVTAGQIVNDVNKIKDQTGALRQMVQHEIGQALDHKIVNGVCTVCNQKVTGRMNEAFGGAGFIPGTQVQSPDGMGSTGGLTYDDKQFGPTGKLPGADLGESVCAKCGGSMQEDVEIEIPMPDGSEGAEVSAEIVPGEEGEGSVAELVIIDDEVTPQTIDNDMIEIEIPDSAAEGLEGGDAELEIGGEPEGGMPEGQGFPGLDGAEGGRPEGDDEFDRMADLAGVEDQEKPAFPPKK